MSEKCKNCGREIISGARICRYCGKPVVAGWQGGGPQGPNGSKGLRSSASVPTAAKPALVMAIGLAVAGAAAAFFLVQAPEPTKVIAPEATKAPAVAEPAPKLETVGETSPNPSDSQNAVVPPTPGNELPDAARENEPKPDLQKLDRPLLPGTESIAQEVPPTQEQALEKGGVSRTIRAHMGAIRKCYEAASRIQAFDATITVAFEIDPNGTVQGAKTVASDVNNPTFEKCVLGQFEKIRFPAPKDGQPVRVESYPLVFKAQ